jgi:outer membrane protein assembly factor BamB
MLSFDRTKTIIIGLLFVITFSLLLVKVPMVISDDTSTNLEYWSMFRHDLQHTGFSSSTAPNTNVSLWNYPTGGAIHSSPAVVDGKVYIGSEDKNVYCIDAISGTLVWNYTTGDLVDSSPAVTDGKVYIGSNDHLVYCLDASTGEQLWNYTTGDAVLSSPTVSEGKVYIGSYDGYLYSLDAITGAQIWNYSTGDAVTSSHCADGKVYIASRYGNVTA